MTCEVYLLEKKNGNVYERKQQLLNESVMNPIERTAESYFLSGAEPFEPVQLNSGDASEYMRLAKVDAGFSEVKANELAKFIQKRETNFGSYEIFVKEIVAAGILTADTINRWKNSGYLSLKFV